ncbi:MAG: DNA primase [Candidatus Heimdallarchaeota archaeon]|nr:DNA primase [Candidatus Heimdallarchaeota archaeon]
MKYTLNLSISVDGIVSEADIVGALFGQTEGLLDENLELKMLQKSGRIGRIDFNLNSKKGKTNGIISIPSSLNKISSAILAATLESVERVGPCDCNIKLDKIVDVRSAKRDQIAKRASEIMKMWNLETQSQTEDISKFVEEDTKKGKIVVFGPDKLSAGPDIFKNPEIIVVEGRADIVNLLKMGLENTIALDGTKVPSTIKNLCKSRDVTVLLDGDRGGDMILKELILTTDIDYVARAPFRKEVEDLNYKEVDKALKNRKPVLEAQFVTEKISIAEFLDNQSSTRSSYKESKGSSRYKKRDSSRGEDKRDTRRDSRQREPRREINRDTNRDKRKPRGGAQSSTKPYQKKTDRRDSKSRRYHQVNIPNEVKSLISSIKQTSKVIFLDNDFKEISSVSTSDAFEHFSTLNDVKTIIIDGVITQRMLDEANKKSVKLITGAVMGELTNKYDTPEIATFNRIR